MGVQLSDQKKADTVSESHSIKYSRPWLNRTKTKILEDRLSLRIIDFRITETIFP